jgi:hypothetical protein
MSLAASEVMTILILFHLSGYRTFKHFYLREICRHWKAEFPHLVSYSRFVELEPLVSLPLGLFLLAHCQGKVSGVSFIDSTVLAVCDNHRIHAHRVFSGLAERGKTSMGWFYGFKLHTLINDRGEFISFALTPGNVDDRNPKVVRVLTLALFGKLFGDKGYISGKLFAELWQRGIKLITRIRKNMRNVPMDLAEKILLRKRTLVETVHNELKNICQIEHTRHRSPANFFVNLLSGLAGYLFLPKKPSLHIEPSAFGGNVKQLVFC